jgi:tetratricopeptide (TPR) repeat protein
MPDDKEFPLESLRTDGWFERIGEGIGSFQALCEIIGARFFAFAMITGARITALTVDRRNPDNTLVDFVVGGSEAEGGDGEAQRLTLADFRRRLVNALLLDEEQPPPPERPTDTEALQLHIGVRYLLLAPLYGYSLKLLEITDAVSRVSLLHDGLEETYPLAAFRARLRAHVREELERASSGPNRGAIDLARVSDAAVAASAGEPMRVVELLGAWPAPLAIFLRTPEGQLLPSETRDTIARGLGLLGTACIDLAETQKGEEILRLAVQYAGDGPTASEIYTRLGEALLVDHRPGEAIGPLRRAVNLGAEGARIWPQLASAFSERGRLLAALGAIEEAISAGAPSPRLQDLRSRVAERLAEAPFQRWQELLEAEAERSSPSGSPPSSANARAIDS